MIGIDTNVLLRFFALDDAPAQTMAVQALIREQSPVFLNPIVLVEFVWALRTSFELDRPTIYARLARVVSAPEFAFAFPEATERAVSHYGNGAAEFADCLIGELNLEFGCHVTMTFDKKASRTMPFRRLEI